MSLEYRVQSPIDNKVLETFDTATDEEIQAVIAKATSAYDDWSALTLAQRSEALGRLAQLYRDNKE